MNLPVYNGNPANLATASQFAYFPGISLNLLDYINVASISIIQPIFMGGQIVNGNKLAKLGYEISKDKQAMTTTEVLVKTEDLYWSAVSLAEKLKTLDSYQKLLNKLESDVTISLKAGLIQRADLLKIQLKQNELQVNRLKLTNGITLSRMALCQQIGITYDSTLVLDSKLSMAENPQLILSNTKAAVENRNEYKMLAKAIKAEELQKKMVAGEIMPQVSIGAMGVYTDVMDKSSKNMMAFATVSIPISDWWGGSHKLKQSKAKIESAKFELSETSELLTLQITQAKNTYNEEYFQIGMAQKSVEEAQENLKVTNDNYKSGVSSMSDLLEAQSTFQSAEDNLIEAQCNYQIKKAKYLEAINNYK
jgi:outer membrane protein TolC